MKSWMTMGQFMVKNQGIGTRKFCGKKVREIFDLLNSIEPEAKK